MIEPLEDRIAPAAVLTFNDSDGDSITVKTSKGTNAQLSAAVARDIFGNIVAITLPNATFEGSDLSVVANIVRNGHGNGHIDVPIINAAGTDLGIVSIDGDVGEGSIGSNSAGTPAVKSFKSLSVGASNAALGALVFNGVVPSFTTVGDVSDLGELVFTGTPAVGNLLGKATIGGSLDGAHTAGGALILVNGSAGSITVKGAVIGGDAGTTGAIEIVGGTTPTNVTVGSLLGGAGDYSGSIRAIGPLGTVVVSKSIVASTGQLSGSIVSTGNISSVSVGHSITGNAAYLSEIAAGASVISGVLSSSGNLGSVKISGSVGIGGNYEILAHDNVGSVIIGGDLSGSYIGSGANTGSVKIGGDVIDSFINAHGNGVGLGLGSVSIGGSVHMGGIYAGQIIYAGQVVDANATLGTVKIGQQANGLLIEGGTNAGISSKINCVTICGPAQNATVISNSIAKIVVEGATAPLTLGASNDNDSFGGVFYNEV